MRVGKGRSFKMKKNYLMTAAKTKSGSLVQVNLESVEALVGVVTECGGLTLI